MFSYYSGIELNLIIIFCDESSIYISNCWDSQHYFYFILSIAYCILKIILSSLISIYGYTKNDLMTSAISKFVISNHVIVLLYTKTFSLLLFFFNKRYSKNGLICFFLLLVSIFFFYYIFLEYKFQHQKNLKLFIYFISSCLYFETCCLLFIGYLINKTSFNGLIYILCVIFILNIIFFITYPEREIKINLNNIYFKSDYEIYNQLSLLINFIQEMGNDRKSMLNLTSYFRKEESIKIKDSNHYFNESLKNNELGLFVCKYIEQTYKSMINKFENSIILKIGYANFLYVNLKKYDKAYIIYFDLFFNKENELTLSQKYYIYISLNYIQNFAIESKTDITNISVRFHCNQLINLISQISEMYYNFWILLLNSKENKDINVLRKMGSKIQKFSEEIDFNFNKFSKIKDKNISLLYLLYKRDILNDFSNDENENEIKELVDSSTFSFKNFNLKSLISTPSLQFLVITLKSDNFGTIVKVSQELSIDLGYTSEELIGQNMNILLPDFIVKKHNQFIKEKVKDLKFIENEENILKKHIFYLKAKSKFLIPIATYVGMVYDDDNKPFVFLKINYDIQQTLFNDLSTNSHILTDKYFNIQNFTSNSIILLNLSNKIINNNINIINYIKEVNHEYYKVFAVTSAKPVDKLNITLSMLKKYFTEEPEHIITFHKIQCKINISKLIINNEILGYCFNLIKIEEENINVKANYSSTKSLIRKNNNIKNVGKIKMSKTKKINFENKSNDFKDINYDYIPENREMNFNFEKKEYYLQNESEKNNTQDTNNLYEIIKKEYLDKKLEIESQKSSSSESSSYSSNSNNSSNSDSDEYSISNESSFSSINEKKENNKINYDNNNNVNDDYYKVKLNKIGYFIYNFNTNSIIEITKNKYNKVEEIFFYEKKKDEIKIKENKKNVLTKEKKIQIGNELIIPEIKKKNELFYLKNKSFFYDKIYSKDISKSIVVLISTEIFHLIMISILSTIFFLLNFNTQNILNNLITSTKYLINLSENINNIFTYSIALVILNNNKYTNYNISKEILVNLAKEQLLHYYNETSNVINSFIHLPLSSDTKKKISQLTLIHHILTNQLEIKQCTGNFLNLLKEINYAVYDFANTDEENLNLLNLNYNFIFYNSNTGLLITINNTVEIFIQEYIKKLHHLIYRIWMFVVIFFIFLILCIFLSLKGYLLMIQEKEKYLKYFFQINDEYIKYNILKCKKFIQLNKASTFDNKYFISNPKIKFENNDDENSEYNENEEYIKFLNEKKSKAKTPSKKKLSKKNFIKDKKNLKKMVIIYFFYIIILILIIISIMIISKQLYYQIYHSIQLYLLIISHKTTLLTLYNYLIIFLIYFPPFSKNIDYKDNFVYFDNFFSSIFDLHKQYKDKIIENINLYGLGLNSSKVYKSISEDNLCDFFISYEKIYNITCDGLSNNISSYGLDSIMIFYIQSLSTLFIKFNNNIKIIEKYGFIYNELFYGTELYNNLTPTDPELLKKYNELNPFNIINSDELRDLNMINEIILKQAFQYISDSIFDDIETIFNNISYIQSWLIILFFICVINFNFIYYFPFLFKKNYEIKQVRHMLLIIPKDILYKLLIEEDNDETKNQY